MRSIKLTVFTVAVLFIQGCALFASTNTELFPTDIKTKATFAVEKDRGNHHKALVILSLSGGGSRAAYWSASVMLALQDVFKDEGLDILKEVDIISSVSGGSLPAAYYVISKDPDDVSGTVRSNRNWDPDTVKDLMTRNYKLRWLGNWFWPNNILKYWFTAFDRSDIMAQTLSDNLFDVKAIGFDLTFKDANPERPYIVLNATNGTAGSFATRFTFTHEDFVKINSDINEYHIGRAVMATASFPAVFNYMTLENFVKSGDKDTYVHVFDGGNYDNLGLTSVEDIIEKNRSNYTRIVVILVDAFTESTGVKSEDYDARKTFDYAVDLNFLDSVDSLLSTNRAARIERFKDRLYRYRGEDKETFFYHIQFSDSKNQGDLNAIKTDFAIDGHGIKAIDVAVKNLIVKENVCLKAIRDILVSGSTTYNRRGCCWKTPDGSWED